MRDYAKTMKRLRRYSENFLAYKLDADFADAVTQAADAIEELLAAVPHWNSVEELPKKTVGDEGYNGYLVFSDGEYQIADYTHDKYMQTAFEFHVDGEYDPNITHWMPLPSAPEEDAE